MILLTKLVDDLFLYPQERNILGLKSGKMHYTTLFYTIKSCCFILKLKNTKQNHPCSTSKCSLQHTFFPMLYWYVLSYDFNIAMVDISLESIVLGQESTYQPRKTGWL